MVISEEMGRLDVSIRPHATDVQYFIGPTFINFSVLFIQPRPITVFLNVHQEVRRKKDAITKEASGNSCNQYNIR